MKESSQMRGALRELFASQKFAALATEDGGKPHNCLVAFAATNDLRRLIFITSRNTSKYRNIKAESRVAVLVDSRANQESDLLNAIAVTAKGRAEEAEGKEREYLLDIYLAKHPSLSDFANSTENALVKVTIKDYEISTFHSTSVLKTH
jgi:nitroimidazol reductase NimA-like FMN-containing flavoprotein (pyridoxamine 5'-phosphate oxidase superfamily)